MMNDSKKTPSKSDLASEFVRRVKAEREATHGFDYRQAALKLFPHVCAHCGRDFEAKDLSQLTVHHKDGNHQNNPRDGSNWELLCVYCHDNEHEREVLAASQQRMESEHGAQEVVQKEQPQAERMVSLADKLKAALDKK